MIDTRHIMTTSGVALGLLGAACLLAPDEILSALRLTAPAFVLQTLGAAYLGMAMANWTARGSMIGGIYAKPIALLNTVHFTVGALSLVKADLASLHVAIVAVGAIYACFAVVFNLLLFGKIGKRPE